MNNAWLALNSRLRWILPAAGLALLALLTACGFQMRGETPLPFDTMYVGVADTTKFGADLRRSLRAASPNTRLVATPKEAQAILQQIALDRSLSDTSLNAQGRVEEYELTLRFVFRLIDQQGNLIIPDTTLVARRQLPYNDQASQALSSQMDSLYASMEQSLISRILRRLNSTDVHENYARLQRGEVNPDHPVFDPAQASPGPAMPSSWSSPTNNLGGPPR